MLACAPTHPYAGGPAVSMADLADEIFVDFYPGCLTRDYTDAAMTAAGADRRVAFEVNEAHSLLDFVAGGLGVAVVPESFTRKRSAAAFVRITGPAPAWTLALASPDGRRLGPAATALLAGDQLAPFATAGLPIPTGEPVEIGAATAGD